MSKSTTKKHSSRRVVNKKVNRKELEAFSKGQNYLDLMEEESNEHSAKMVSLLFQAKKAAKCELMETGGKAAKKQAEAPKTPLILLFATDMNGDKELFPREKLFRLLEGLTVLKVKIIVIDTQQPADLNNLGELPEHSAGQIVWYNPRQDDSGQGREEKEIDRLLLAADLAVLFNHQTELVQLLKNYGVVMIADDNCPLLENYRPNEESGNAFLFDQKDLWSVFAAIVRALETFRFPFDWQHIIRNMQK
jgi:hypothetical protein